MIAAPYNTDGWLYRYLCPDLIKNSIPDRAILEGLLSDCHRQDVHYGYINQAKGVLITRLDTRLPRRLLGVWREDLFGAAVDVNLRLEDCGEFGKDVPELKADIPVCVESRVTPRQNRSTTLLLLMSATHQAALEPRVLNITVGTEQEENLHFQSLHELAKYVFNKGWAVRRQDPRS